MSLPLVRTHERIDYKRCPKKWYWRWRMGLVPRAISFGELDLGTWVHNGLAAWYGEGTQRNGSLAYHFNVAANAAIAEATRAGAPEHALTRAEELASLGEAMVRAYEDFYGIDPTVHVIGAEVPLEFSIPDENGVIVAKHLLKPDLVFREARTFSVWLMETKTAASIQSDHLVIDDQARPYGAMTESALRRLRMIPKRFEFKGIVYNYLRKGLPDERPTDAAGKYLNKNGSVSRRQPPPLFVRKPVTLTRAAKVIALRRIRVETVLITEVTQALKDGRIDAATLPKTPHRSCPRFCQYFAMCVVEEEGGNIEHMRRTMFRRENPYDYAETTAEPTSFEMGS